MEFVAHKSRVKTIRPGDSDFTITDGFVTYPRAMLHVIPDCPLRVRETVEWAIANGYIKCVANVYNTEHLRDKLAGI